MSNSSIKITEIDIGRQSRALYFLRLTDYLLVIFCGYMLLGFLFDPLINPESRNVVTLIIYLIAIPILSFSVYTGWRHVGVIDEKVWRDYLIVFPVLFLFCISFAGLISLALLGGSISPEESSQLIVLLAYASCITVVGFISVLLLKKMPIAIFDVPLSRLLYNIRNQRGPQAAESKKIKKVNAPRGIVFGVLGAIILLGSTLFLLATNPGPEQANVYQGISNWIDLVGFFLIIKARRYFQVSADSLLAVDKRKPILFLRSFADDEKLKFNTLGTAILDFSLETRLANHFIHFGPFIAIGSPKDTVPQLGAARAILSDSEWQPQVMGWMKEACLVVMYSGNSQWVNWELAILVVQEQCKKLILMLPEVKGWRKSVRAKDISARIEHVREAFRDTKWCGALGSLADYRTIRAILFRDDGSLIVIKSKPRNRDSYHLAAMIAHYILLSMSKFVLVGISGPVQGWRFSIGNEFVRIGADTDNDLIINNDDYVSRHHVSLRCEQSSLSITDQHSTNGTFVNDKRLGDSPQEIYTGDRIRLGKSVFEVAAAEGNI